MHYPSWISTWLTTSPSPWFPKDIILLNLFSIFSDSGGSSPYQLLWVSLPSRSSTLIEVWSRYWDLLLPNLLSKALTHSAFAYYWETNHNWLPSLSWYCKRLLSVCLISIVSPLCSHARRMPPLGQPAFQSIFDFSSPRVSEPLTLKVRNPSPFKDLMFMSKGWANLFYRFYSSRYLSHAIVQRVMPHPIRQPHTKIAMSIMAQISILNIF